MNNMAMWCEKCIRCAKHGALVNYGVIFACDDEICDFVPMEESTFTDTTTTTYTSGTSYTYYLKEEN